MVKIGRGRIKVYLPGLVKIGFPRNHPAFRGLIPRGRTAPDLVAPVENGVSTNVRVCYRIPNARHLQRVGLDCVDFAGNELYLRRIPLRSMSNVVPATHLIDPDFVERARRKRMNEAEPDVFRVNVTQIVDAVTVTTTPARTHHIGIIAALPRCLGHPVLMGKHARKCETHCRVETVDNLDHAVPL